MPPPRKIKESDLKQRNGGQWNKVTRTLYARGYANDRGVAEMDTPV